MKTVSDSFDGINYVCFASQWNRKDECFTPSSGTPCDIATEFCFMCNPLANGINKPVTFNVHRGKEDKKTLSEQEKEGKRQSSVCCKAKQKQEFSCAFSEPRGIITSRMCILNVIKKSQKVPGVALKD